MRPLVSFPSAQARLANGGVGKPLVQTWLHGQGASGPPRQGSLHAEPLPQHVIPRCLSCAGRVGALQMRQPTLLCVRRPSGTTPAPSSCAPLASTQPPPPAPLQHSATLLLFLPPTGTHPPCPPGASVLCPPAATCAIQTPHLSQASLMLVAPSPTARSAWEASPAAGPGTCCRCCCCC